MNKTDVLCVGEVLWDALPAGLFLGGAVFNVACHLHEQGLNAEFASRAGNDELGREIRRRIESRGMSARFLQTDDALATGFVIVTLDEFRSPVFDIVHPSAWDAIEISPDLVECASSARAVVFGTLAQRDAVSRRAIQTLWNTKAIRALDINLRPPYYSREIVEESLKHCDLLKLNDQEYERFMEWFGIPGELEKGAHCLEERFGCQTLCVTRGANGAALLHKGTWCEHPGFSVRVADTVGAGDAFLAALLAEILTGAEPARALEQANAVGAFVATQNGATPKHDNAAIMDIIRHHAKSPA
ncbi:MAG: carbohydrate kinase [bacterium]|nr:carbohydrate kinase [Candidatus Sumerlaeota bacterium]